MGATRSGATKLALLAIIGVSCIYITCADSNDTTGTCKAGDKQCAAPSEKSDDDLKNLKHDLEEIEKKKKKLEEKLKKKREADAKKKAKKSEAGAVPKGKDTKENANDKEESEEERKQREQHEKDEKEKRGAKSTWIFPESGKKVASGGCSMANFDACSETEKRLLKARPVAYLGSGEGGGALVKTKTKSGALMIKEMKNEEDCLVKYLMTESDLKDIEDGTFVEIGAGDGKTDSKTHKFETLRKWTGLCVEPHEKLYGELSESGRKCKPLKLAIGQKEGTKKFSSRSYKLTEGGDKAVDVKRLGTLLANENIKKVDLLRVHTNGTEMDVLKSIDLNKAKIDTISLPHEEGKLHPKLPRMLMGAGWHPVTTDEKRHKKCPPLKTLFRKHFWPTPLEWENLILNWLSPQPKSWQSQNGLDITLRLENFPTDEKVRREMELLIQTQRLKVHMFWNGNSVGVYPFVKTKKVIAKPKAKPKGKPKKSEKGLTKKEDEPEMFYYDYEIDIPLVGLKINAGRHTLWARLINRDGGTPTGLENTTNFLVCETPSAYMILEARIQGENCLIDDWIDEGEAQEMVSQHGSLHASSFKEHRIKREQAEHAERIKAEREAQKKKEEEEKRRCEAGEEEFCPKKVVIDDTPVESTEDRADETIEVPEEKVEDQADNQAEKEPEAKQPDKKLPEEKPKAAKGKRDSSKKDKQAPVAEPKDPEGKLKAEDMKASNENKPKKSETSGESKDAGAKAATDAKASKAAKASKDAKAAKASKDAKSKGGAGKNPQLTTGKVEVGKGVSGKVSAGEVTVSKETGLALSEQKNCTDNLGVEPDKPGRSCLHILENSCEEPTNGFYWLNVTDSKEWGKPLNRWRLVQTRCDMEFNHGGWTRILVCSGSEHMPWNTFGEDDFLINKYAVQFLAGNATQVHIRTYNRPDIFIVSVPGAAPIQLLRQGAPLNIPIHNDSDPLHGVKNNWYGSMQHFMNWNTGQELAPHKLEYPQVVYWAANNANGLHIVNQPPPAAAKMVKAGFGRFEGAGTKDKICTWTLKGWHPIASVQRGSLPTTARKNKKPHSVEDGRGMDALEVFIR